MSHATVSTILTSAIVAMLISSCASAAPSNLRHRTSRTVSQATGTYIPPTFEPAPGWYTATGPVTVASNDVPRSWASNRPFAEQNHLVGFPPDQTIPPHWATSPEATFRQIAADQVVLVAMFELPEMTPAPSGNPNFPDATMPVTLTSFDEEPGWKGQSPGTAIRYRGLFRVNDQYLRIEVYFSTEEPPASMLDEAQSELARLVVPPGLRVLS
jgi:hypothetical protein